MQITKNNFVELLIFDLDGTIADTSVDIARAVNETRMHKGLSELPPDRIVSYVGNGLRPLLSRCLDTSEESVLQTAESIFKEYYSLHLLDHTTLYPGVSDILEHFRTKKLAIASNKPHEFVKKILDRFEISNYFTVILGGDSPIKKKPAPDQPLYILKKTGVDPRKTVLVGDSINDVRAAEHAHIISCYILSGFNKGIDLSGAKPDVLIRSMSELKKYFH